MPRLLLLLIAVAATGCTSMRPGAIGVIFCPPNHICSQLVEPITPDAPAGTRAQPNLRI